MKHKILFLILLLSFTGASQITAQSGNPRKILMPYNRMIQPAGTQIFFGDASRENHALDAALSPDGKWLAVEERFSIIFISTSDNSVKFILRNFGNRMLGNGMNTYSGITWHRAKDGLEIYWSASGRGRMSYVASARWDGEKAIFGRMFGYKPEKDADLALPNEILIKKESKGEYLYVVLNGNNKVIKQNFTTGDTIWVAEPGVAPYGLTMAAGKLYVTNWAGREPGSDDKQVAGVPWGLARVNNNAGGSTREGSVAVINPSDGKIIKEIIVGLHPNEIISDREGKKVYVTNSNSDNVSIINTSNDNVEKTLSVKLQPEINTYFGDSPNGLCLSPDEKTLFIANGMDNALAVIDLRSEGAISNQGTEKSLLGFIPTGAYPTAVTMSEKGNLYVSNLEAIGARIGINHSATKNMVYNSHNMMASISVIHFNMKDIKAYTDTVYALNNLSRATKGLEKPRNNISAVAVPERIGEPSLFKHVLYIIKENRTYDQILGDMKEGDGEPGLCIYGDSITPNIHKLAKEFLLLDNFHVSGKCSAEGHQWTDASIVTDYIEKNVRAWFRSYPHVQNDALVYAPSGFLWDNAMKYRKNVRIYGEASVPILKEKITWPDVYKKFRNGEKVEFINYTTIEPVKKILSQTYPAYGDHDFPDVMRADAFIKELHSYESMPGDKLPELMIMALPNDHTAGVRPGYPTPKAMVADNDYALGLIVQAVTKSRFWKNTVIFVVEDDSQNGWDHVSAYRTVALVLSPYSRLKTTNHTYYTQPSMVRTIEQILGMKPMNIQDAIANNMSECFGKTINLTPYKAVKNKVPLDELNPRLFSLRGKALHYAKKSMLPEYDGVDSGDDYLLNRILWFAEKGNTPYPAKFAGKKSRDDHDNDDD
jgi:YVTN family beta-propeller protein